MSQPFELPNFYMPYPARLNRHLPAARAHSTAWAREMGMLEGSGVWVRDDLEAHDYGLLCAYTHPDCDAALSLITDWYVWVFFFDDHFLEGQYEGEIHNGVLVVQNFFGCDYPRALGVVDDLMTQRLRRFQHVAARELPVLYDDLALSEEARTTLDGYVVQLQDWIAGSQNFYRGSHRYGAGDLARRRRRLPPSGTGPTGPSGAWGASEGVPFYLRRRRPIRTGSWSDERNASGR